MSLRIDIARARFQLKEEPSFVDHDELHALLGRCLTLAGFAKPYRTQADMHSEGSDRVTVTIEVDDACSFVHELMTVDLP